MHTITHIDWTGLEVHTQVVGSPTITLEGWAEAVELVFPNGTVLTFTIDDGWGILVDDGFANCTINPPMEVPAVFKKYYGLD